MNREDFRARFRKDRRGLVKRKKRGRIEKVESRNIISPEIEIKSKRLKDYEKDV